MINNFIYTDDPYSVVVSKGPHCSRKLACWKFNAPSLPSEHSSLVTCNTSVYPGDFTVCWELWLSTASRLTPCTASLGKDHNFKYSLYQIHNAFVIYLEVKKVRDPPDCGLCISWRCSFPCSWRSWFRDWNSVLKGHSTTEAEQRDHACDASDRHLEIRYGYRW